MFNLDTCARPNILSLQPYRCARDDYKDDGTNILLDANENAYGPSLKLEGTRTHHEHDITSGSGTSNGSQSYKNKPEIDFLGLHRYPDPHQEDLKQLLCTFRNTHTHTIKDLSPANLFVGVGSDEAIDATLRCFCRPGHDRILTCPPTYGMYAVSAQVNDLGYVQVPLDVTNDFALMPDSINSALSNEPNIKVVYICSPGNPTATLVDKEQIRQVLEHPTWNGIVVLDEAYIDFAPDGSSLAEWVLEWPNLIVMQTLSKAFGLAGIRLGAAFTSPPVARLLNNLKAPYNISSPTSVLAQAALAPQSIAKMRKHREQILEQRDRLLKELPRVAGIGRFVGGRASNFLLVELLDKPGGKASNEVANAVYESLAATRGVVVRFRGKEFGCQGCLRITVGTEPEVSRFLDEIEHVLGRIYGGELVTGGPGEKEKQKQANAVIS
ncbi:MAG: histidinol-phosphate transaminase [Vezdaea aestivalis]|nr:MAG: histidinol-phosphate transaminase [Vezdaea aestivalis]